MVDYLNNFIKTMKPAFSRNKTFGWFVICFTGFIVRQDTYGVSSIIRALFIEPFYYPCLLHFFHSSAWNTQVLLEYWWQWLFKDKAVQKFNDRIVLFGDHTKIVKDGRKMPEVSTLHQDSETGSKPSFFRGHHWGCISLLIKAKEKSFSTPIFAEIHRDDLNEKLSTRIVSIAIQIVLKMKSPAILVLDAFFSVGPVFDAVAKKKDILHILTRAKKNIVAYMQPVKTINKKVGRPAKYGKKLKLMTLFETRADQFTQADTKIYDKIEKVQFLVLDLLWRPVKDELRFILLESSRGRIILITSDLNMDPLLAIKLYCNRVSIETLFNTLKNLFGGMRYHFWSMYLKKISRKPIRNSKTKTISTNPEKTKNTLIAIEKFVTIIIIVLGVLQLLACRFPKEIFNTAKCWLRTPCKNIPSEFVTKVAVTKLIHSNLISFAKDTITQLILKRQKHGENYKNLKEAA